MFADDGGETLGNVVQRLVPAGPLACFGAVAAHFRVYGAAFATGGKVQGGTLGAKASEIGRVLRVAVHADDAVVL